MATEFQRNARWLRKQFPVDCRVYVKLCPRIEIRNEKDPPEHRGNDGVVNWLGNSFRIRIADDLSEEMKAITLDHEWAHVMAFPRQNRKHHIRDWQLAYGAIAAAREKRLGNP